MATFGSSGSQPLDDDDSTPPRKATTITDRMLKDWDARIDELAAEVQVAKFPKISTLSKFRHLRTITQPNAGALLAEIQQKLENFRPNTTPQRHSATDGMSPRSLIREEIQIYIANFAWPDTETAISTKGFIEELIKADGFGAFNLILKDRSQTTELRADPAMSWEMFENMWRHDGNDGTFTEEIFQGWFELKHISKLGMCYKQPASKRESEYKSIGGLNFGVRRYFPAVFSIKWQNVSRKQTEQNGFGTLPTNAEVAYAIEEHLQQGFLPAVATGGSKKKSPKTANVTRPSGGMLNHATNPNARMFKWEYIFNRTLDSIEQQVEEALTLLMTQTFVIKNEEVQILSYELIKGQAVKMGSLSDSDLLQINKLRF